MPPAPSPPPTSPIHCKTCSYDITSLPISAICPECTTPCRASHQAHHQALALLTHGKRHRIGYRIFLVGFTAFLTVPILLLIYILSSRNLAFSYEPLVLAWLITPFIMFPGIWLMTGMPTFAITDPVPPKRKPTRFLAIAAIAFHSLGLGLYWNHQNHITAEVQDVLTFSSCSSVILNFFAAIFTFAWNWEFKRLVRVSAMLKDESPRSPK